MAVWGAQGGKPVSTESEADYGRGIWNVWLWIAIGLIFWGISFFTSSGPRSPYWASELLLYALMLVGMWANRKHQLSKRSVSQSLWHHWLTFYWFGYLGCCMKLA